MLRYTLRRLSWLPVILFTTSLIAFVMLRTLPGQDPVDVIAGQGATEEQKQQVREQLGLERPMIEQYWDWLSGVLVGDFGTSYESQAPVRDQFKDKFPLSFELVLISVAFSAVFGIAAGIISALYRNGMFDYGVRLFAVMGASVPSFFLLTLLVVVPSNLWNYVQPVGGDVGLLDNPARNLRLILPTALVLGVASSVGLMRLVRTTMLEVLRADYVRTAHAKGLPRLTVVLSHALRNSATPIVTALGAEFILIFGGSIIAEQILSIRGVGEWFFLAAFKRDLPVVQCDPSHIEQVFLALMMNAIDAMPRGGNLWVRTRPAAAPNHSVEVQIQDDGVGIAPDVVPHLFEPFFTTKERGHGVGLGLAISHGIIERHHGTIAVQSESGRGTTFTILLPVSRLPAPPAGASELPTHAAKAR